MNDEILGFLVAEMGFFIAPSDFVYSKRNGLSAILRADTQNDAVCCRLRTASIDPDAFGTSFECSVIERRSWKGQTRFAGKKEKHTTRVCFFVKGL